MSVGSLASYPTGHSPAILPGHHSSHQMHPHYINQQPHQQLIKPDPGMERSNSPHGSEHSQYSNHHMQRSFPSPMHTPMHMANQMQGHMPLPSFPDMSNMTSMSSMAMQQLPQQPQQSHQQQAAPSQGQSAPTKTYPCKDCGKPFARRSDLARHERIHSGIKPHVCDYPDCGKPFIQRSALTVHQRTHTGEKPHHCETCAKRFSDSSSLARHRRIHSGKRPYKCPYADCQKTFTRRTTLTRHQNGHTGTVEEHAAATAAILREASRTDKPRSMARSDGDHLSAHGSPMTTPSPGHRTMSMSPSIDLPRHGHPSDLQFMQTTGGLPAHLRVGSPVSTSSAGGYNGGMRPTSHPTGYGPPPVLEPSLDQHQSGPNSANGSPHMTSVGWQSPSHISSPSQNGSSYVYPDPDAYPPNPAMSQMYYGAAPQMRRPQSTEPGMVHMG